MANAIQISRDGSELAPLHGHQVVGLVAKQLTILGGNKLTRGVVIRAPGPNDIDGNLGVVFVGAAGVTADKQEGTGGMPIPPGESLTIPCINPSTLYVIGTVDGDDVAWIGI